MSKDNILQYSKKAENTSILKTELNRTSALSGSTETGEQDTVFEGSTVDFAQKKEKESWWNIEQSFANIYLVVQ